MSSQSNYPAEADIADHHLQFDDDEDPPPRPTSRLSFNGEPVVPPRPRRVSWTKNLFHKIGIPMRLDMDITRASPADEDDDDDEFDPVSLPILPSLSASASPSVSDLDVDEEYDDFGSDSDEGYSSGDSDIDLDSPAEYGQGGSGDLLLFPPVPQALPIPLPPLPSPPTRARYTALPSPLSPAASSPLRRCPTPMRHAYGHHGHSRHALLHLKFLWALREDAALRPRPRFTRHNVPPQQPLPLPPLPLPPLTIHPRAGDLAALRDPYPAHMDRCFGGMPLFTMCKTIWMYDVHLGAAAGQRSDDEDSSESGNESGSEGDSESLASSQSASSDDTLVGEEEEVNLIDLHGEVEVEKPMKKPTPYPRTTPVWETSWYKRWEVLLELVRIERAAQEMTVAPPRARPSAPRFFIGDGDDDEEEGEERWDEEDEVVIVSW
ncbi:hypothetical protein C8R46DRAFT_1185227 [Mycena filopes]|nr:hypothetical protein C8R46DRAFT_1185227 [Mycena filopes]